LRRYLSVKAWVCLDVIVSIIVYTSFARVKVVALATSFLPQLMMQLQLMMAMDGSGVCGGKELACVMTEKAPTIKCAMPCAR
jgi:hypothetical protein